VLALIDADIVAFRCAASAEKDPVDIALHRVDIMLDETMVHLQADKYRCFLSGSNNFRYNIYPEYKANRKDKIDPVHRQACIDHIVRNWNGEVTDGYEADDALGIASGPDAVICSIDKDLRQIPGKHFNLVSKVLDEVSDWQGHFNFYSQLILGDRSDNVKGYDGIMRTTIPKFLQYDFDILNNSETELEMFEHVHNMYKFKNNVADMNLNGQLLWIWRKENDKWHFESLKQEMEQTYCSLDQ